MPAPDVSVVLPCRNADATLGECLDSIVAQTLTNFEVIAVDDHSSDGTGERLEAISARDRRFRFFRSPERGLVPALNFGLSQAVSEHIARMDADDRMHPRRLELQHRHLACNPHISVLGSRVRAFPEDVITEGMQAYVRWLNGCISADSIRQDLYLESPLAHPSVMFRRGDVVGAGGYRDGPFPEDYDLWLRLSAAGMELAKLPQTLTDWRDGPQRTSRLDPRYARESFDRLRARYLAEDPRLLHHRGHLAIWGAGRKTRKRVHHLLKRGYRPRAWIDIDPRKIGNRIDGVPVIAPERLIDHGRPFVLSYVAVHGARECIEGELDRLGYRKGKDYLHVG